MADGAPLKLIDIQDSLSRGARAMTPDSLAFYLGFQDINPAPAGFDRRRLPFGDISPQLRDQRQASLAMPQNTPFSAMQAANLLQRQANLPK